MKRGKSDEKKSSNGASSGASRTVVQTIRLVYFPFYARINPKNRGRTVLMTSDQVSEYDIGLKPDSPRYYIMLREIEVSELGCEMTKS